ncbi:MAG: helix-turn-helix transcriptional regulator [Clostridia bacterium]|nr:helix-turn-helix transcriptional regulator [Clostridia bacterium]
MEIYIERIIETRKRKNIQQKELCVALGMKQAQLSRYEREGNALPIKYFIKIAEYLNEDTNYLLGLTDEPRSLE